MPESSKKVRRRPAGKGKKKQTKEIVEKQLVSSMEQKMVIDTCDESYTNKQENRDINKESEPSSMKQSVVPTAKKPVDKLDVNTPNFYVKPDYVPIPIFPPIEGGTKLVFMDNLHPDVKESDVIEFFKDDGKINRVAFFGKQFSGCGDVLFDTSEAAKKALKRNGDVFFGRILTLLPSEERTKYDFFTPSDDQKYLFMGNLSLSVEENDIVEFFKDVGEIVSVSLMSEGYPFDGKKSVAHVQFASSTIAYKAYRRYGRMLHGRRVEFALATEESVWYSSTPSSSKPPRGPGWGSLSGPCCSRCKMNLGI